MGKYTEQVAYLKQNPDEIVNHWYDGRGMFAYRDVPAYRFLCLTMIRNHRDILAAQPSIHPLVLEIANDDTMPHSVTKLGFQHLDLIASYNERLDEAGIESVGN